jgi:uncharacterized membrane protein YgcG
VGFENALASTRSHTPEAEQFQSKEGKKLHAHVRLTADSDRLASSLARSDCLYAPRKRRQASPRSRELGHPLGHRSRCCALQLSRFETPLWVLKSWIGTLRETPLAVISRLPRTEIAARTNHHAPLTVRGRRCGSSSSGGSSSSSSSSSGSGRCHGGHSILAIRI